LATFRNRFPTKGDTWLVLAACVTPIYSWAILTLLYNMRPLLLRHSIWDLAGILSYRLIFAAFETLLVLSLLILLCIILPGRWLRDRFASEGSMIALVTSLWIIAFQLGSGTLRGWSLWPLLAASLYLASVGILYVLILRHRRVEQAVLSFVERLTVFTYVYIALSVLGLLVVVFRNLTL
jgi:hypothetical protein